MSRRLRHLLPASRSAQICAAATIAILGGAAAASAGTIKVIDVIPVSQSAEEGQNSEPSLGVNPVDPTQMISSAFSSTFSGNGVSSPYWTSNNGGTTWAGFDSLPSSDKTIAWRQDGVAALTTTLNCNTCDSTTFLDHLTTYQSGASNFGAPINTSAVQSVDQPWIRTGPGGQTYVAFNGFNPANASGKTASIEVSGNNGVTFGAPVTLETVAPAGGQDAPSVRTAVNGSTVYAVFTRWGTESVIDPNQSTFPGSQVVVVKSTDSGATFSAGVTAAGTTGYFANAKNTLLTLGQERTSSDVAIAVDPNNANRVVVAYGNADGKGLLRLNVVESTDGGATWSAKFATSTAVRSGLPGLSILQNGAVGLLYESYDPVLDKLSQHFVTTTDDFATTSDTLLGTQSNAVPLAAFSPYVGDFFDLTSVGNTFAGIFSASNADEGVLGLFPDVSFQRDFTGTPGTGTFALTDASGGLVGSSVDPFVFSQTVSLVPAPEPATLTLLGTGLFGLAALRRRRRGQQQPRERPDVLRVLSA